jgi:hypothetical protein
MHNVQCVSKQCTHVRSKCMLCRTNFLLEKVLRQLHCKRRQNGDFLAIPHKILMFYQVMKDYENLLIHYFSSLQIMNKVGL